MIKGIGASSGVAMGKAFVVPTWEWDFPEEMIDVTDLAKEYERLYSGIISSKDELQHIKHDIVELVGQESSQIFDAHLAILEDPMFISEIEAVIERQYKAAEVAVKEVMDKFVKMFDLIDDEYMKERALDIKDVGNRLLKHLLGDADPAMPVTDEPYILVTKELTPSQMAHLDPSKVLGIATMLGGKNSHTSIMSRALSIPYVFGLEGKLMRPIHSGDFLIVDGEEGTVYVNPDHETISYYQKRKQEWLQYREDLQKLIHVPSVTRDGVEVQLAANINSVDEAEHVLNYGVSGIGLFRTELLFMDREVRPSEEEQYAAYKKVAEQIGDRPLIIRTLDIGGDKQLDFSTLYDEENPALGYRAIRISLEMKQHFKSQLRAILRAGAHGRSVKIMYPMISSLEEIRQANELLAEAKAELAAANIPYKDDIEVGIMIEIPSAAFMADVLAQEVDFFSIGTNDLVQFMLAVDRMNEKVAHLYEPYHPAVIRMLKHIADAAHRAGIPVSVCGELANDPNALPIWLGLGIKQLSMSVQSILHVKRRLIESESSCCTQLMDRLFQCATSAEIKRLLSGMNGNRLSV